MVTESSVNENYKISYKISSVGSKFVEDGAIALRSNEICNFVQLSATITLFINESKLNICLKTMCFF